MSTPEQPDQNPPETAQPTAEQKLLALAHGHLSGLVTETRKVIAEIERFVPPSVLRAIGKDAETAAIDAAETAIESKM